MNNERKSSGLPLLPFLIFIAIYMGAGIILQIQGVEMAFYQFPSVVAMFIAVIVGFAIHYKTGVNGNFAIFAKGAGNEDILTMLMIFLLAGAFSTVASAMGGIDSTVNLGVSIILDADRRDLPDLGIPVHCNRFVNGDGSGAGSYRTRHCR